MRPDFSRSPPVSEPDAASIAKALSRLLDIVAAQSVRELKAKRDESCERLPDSADTKDDCFDDPLYGG